MINSGGLPPDAGPVVRISRGERQKQKRLSIAKEKRSLKDKTKAERSAGEDIGLERVDEVRKNEVRIFASSPLIFENILQLKISMSGKKTTAT